MQRDPGGKGDGKGFFGRVSESPYPKLWCCDRSRRSVWAGRLSSRRKQVRGIRPEQYGGAKQKMSGQRRRTDCDRSLFRSKFYIDQWFSGSNRRMSTQALPGPPKRRNDYYHELTRLLYGAQKWKQIK